MELKENETLVAPEDKKLIYSGRIDFFEPSAPIFIYPASSVSMRFTGAEIKILVSNNHSYDDNYIGYILDGIEKKVLLYNSTGLQEIELAIDLDSRSLHKLTLFKRQDGCHEFTFYGFIISKDGWVDAPQRLNKRCIEFYCDSLATGEYVEAENIGEIEKKNTKGKYLNAWNSYAMMTARNLKASASMIAQRGLSLLDNAGYFHEPNTIGMESIYDKLHFNPDFGRIDKWDFNRFTPQVVVIDIGQNDASSEDYMLRNSKNIKASIWQKHYREFVLNIRKLYPKSLIVLTTTIVEHHPSWDRTIGKVCRDINDEKIVHFLYSNNGFGKRLFFGANLAEQMSFELSMFIKSFGSEIWLNK